MITFYILPDKANDLRKKFDRMVANISNKPVMTIGEPEAIEIKTYYTEGRVLIDKHSKRVSLCHVEIDNISADGWVWVAVAYHTEGIMRMINADYFKAIPEGFGLDYMICDECGKKEPRRKESHIICNPTTGEWKQVGSSCVNKMFDQGSYLGGFAVKLYNTIKMFDGISEEEYCEGRWSVADHYFEEALSVKHLVPCVVDYRKENPVWEKRVTDKWGYPIVVGTTKKINHHYDDNDYDINEQYWTSLSAFVASLPSSDFNDGIKDAFNAEYIARNEVYKVFFAIKMYDESQLPSYEEECARLGIIEGEKIAINAKVLSCERYEDPYAVFNPISYLFTMQDIDRGIIFNKYCSHPDALESYKTGEDTYSFKGNVGFINRKKRVVSLKGRLSKK